MIASGVGLMIFGAIGVLSAIAVTVIDETSGANYRDLGGCAMGCFVFVVCAALFYFGLVLVMTGTGH